jgi:ABC-2 type transport system ATP-binding protein
MEQPVVGGPAAPEPLPHPRAAAADVVEVDDASRSFGSTTVIDGISFSVKAGEILGLIGPSGCGKTTLIQMLIGQRRPTGGEVRMWGMDPAEFGPREKERFGYVPQGFVLFPSLTVEQNARFVAGIYGMGFLRRRRRIRETLRLLELWDARKRLARNISGGMQRRLALACGLLHEPELVFIDEPTAGLDPILRTKIWDHLRDLRDQGMTAIVTTQYLDEAANCDRVAFMRGGKLIAVGQPEELRERVLGGQALDIDAPGASYADVQAIRELWCVRRAFYAGQGELRVIVEDTESAIPVINDLLRDRDVRVESLREFEPSFDDVFLALVSEPEKDAEESGQ